MADITVHRHGDRWAVKDARAESPIKEFPTREAAELAAEQMADGGRIDVLEEDPTGLDAVQDPDAGEPAHGTATEAGPGGTQPKPTAGDALERSREPQTGL
jgi:Uncharacterized protein conserved in bacteria (DUF2188)